MSSCRPAIRLRHASLCQHDRHQPLLSLRCLQRGAIAMCLIVTIDVHPEFRIILASRSLFCYGFLSCFTLQRPLQQRAPQPQRFSRAAAISAFLSACSGCSTLCFGSLPRLPVVGASFDDPLSSSDLCSSSVDVTVCEDKVFLVLRVGGCARTLFTSEICYLGFCSRRRLSWAAVTEC